MHYTAMSFKARGKNKDKAIPSQYYLQKASFVYSVSEPFKKFPYDLFFFVLRITTKN